MKTRRGHRYISQKNKRSPFHRVQAMMILAVCVSGSVWLAAPLQAQLNSNTPQAVELLNGMRYEGRLGSISEMGPTASNPDPNFQSQPITLIDDDIRKVFVSKLNIANFAPIDLFEEEFEIWQMVKEGDGLGTEIGPILGIGEFDEFGRREITVQTRKGAETVIQGITRINPRYVRVQGVVNKLGPDKTWDMRLAITSIRTQVLVSVLERQIRDPEDANERIRLVDFYVQANMYRQAEKALRDIRRDFPGLKEELKNRADRLGSQVARQTLNEARLRFRSGQPELAQAFLERLENDTLGIADAILVEIADQKNQISQVNKSLEETRTTTLEFAQKYLEVPDISAELKASLEILIEELNSELSSNNFQRFSTFLRFIDDASQTDEQKIAYALSGWVLGAGSSSDRIAEAQELLQTRALVLEYLRTPRMERRLEILQQLETMETGIPQTLDQIIKNIKPPLAPSMNEISTVEPMTIEIELPQPAGRPPKTARYLVQLPPEYDPYRRYPTVVTLGGGTVTTTPELQIDFWCGRRHSRVPVRTGQASRHGYIVVAPDWMAPEDATYQFSVREHAIVLKSLRDAIRRFSIDTDRVFLSGHFAGANAAWDIGQAHPEHWAGVIPISARVEKYVNHYHSNGKFHMRWYFINGGRDFPSTRANASAWNWHMRSPREFDTIVVYYHGRGTERFSDELPNLFLWMSPQRRQFDVRKFECVSLRPWDNYFWWLEVDLAGNPKMIMPERNWQSIKDRSNWDIQGEVKDSRPNLFHVRGAGRTATLWLSPGIVDFSRNVEIGGTSGQFKGGVKPSRRTLLEDVRTRSDRQHPYWAKIVKKNNVWQVEE